MAITFWSIMSTDDKFTLSVLGLVFAIIALTATAINFNRQKHELRVLEGIANSPNPVATRCAYDLSYANTPLCILSIAGKPK